MNSNYQIFGIIGRNIEYSLSPAIYNALFAHHRVKAIYNIFELSPNELKSFVKAVQLLKFSGFNVTIPYKQRILSCLESADIASTNAQSVNMVINKNGKLQGYNTDLQGIRESCEKALRFDARGQSVAIIGSGGSAHTAYYYLVKQRCARIDVYHHSQSKAKLFRAFAKTLPRSSVYHEYCFQKTVDLRSEYDLCINCTPVAILDLMKTGSLAKLDHILELRYGVYKMISNRHVNGNLMLAVQAAANFKLMTGIDVTSTKVLGIIERALTRD